MNVNYVEINDATYAYTVHGKGETMVLLHGFTGSSNTWENVICECSKQFQVITIDLPGHGKTKSDSPKTMETFCQDLNQLLTELHIESCHLLGYSLGGRAALSFAMYFPEKVTSLLLESASPGLKTEEERIERMQQDAKLAERLMEEGVNNFVSFWENIPLFHSQKKLPQAVREKVRAERVNQSELGLAQSLLYMGTGKQPSRWDKLNNITMPVLLIVGEEDVKFVELNKEMQLHIQNAQLVMVENAGHAVHVEQVEKFAKIVVEFLE